MERLLRLMTPTLDARSLPDECRTKQAVCQGRRILWENAFALEISCPRIFAGDENSLIFLKIRKAWLGIGCESFFAFRVPPREALCATARQKRQATDTRHITWLQVGSEANNSVPKNAAKAG
jgi:hypothetical protein